MHTEQENIVLDSGSPRRTVIIKLYAPADVCLSTDIIKQMSESTVTIPSKYFASIQESIDNPITVHTVLNTTYSDSDRPTCHDCYNCDHHTYDEIEVDECYWDPLIVCGHDPKGNTDPDDGEECEYWKWEHENQIKKDNPNE